MIEESQIESDSHLHCDSLPKYIKKLQLMNHSSASPTRIGFSSYKNHPISIKMFLDWTKYDDIQEDNRAQIEGLKYELKIYKNLVPIMLKFSPNFVKYIGYSECTLDKVRNLLETKDAFEDMYRYYTYMYRGSPVFAKNPLVTMIITEKAGGRDAEQISTLFDAWKTMSDRDKANVLFQIIYTIVVMQQSFRLVHNDLHASNILVAKFKNPVKRLYTVNKDKMFMVETRFVPYIFDWDMSYSDALGPNPRIDVKVDSYMCKEVNICNRFSEKTDLYVILCTLQFPELLGTQEYYDRISAHKELKTENKLSKEQRNRLESLPYYIKSEHLYKLGPGHIKYVFGEPDKDVYPYSTANSVILKHIRGTATVSTYSGFDCRPTAYSKKMRTPLELLESNMFDSLRVNNDESIPDKDRYALPSFLLTKAKIYKDPFVKSTRDKIVGKPAMK
jgi:hypothetical protein